WNDPKELRRLAKALEDPLAETTYRGTNGLVKGTAEALVGMLGDRETGGSYFTFSDENNYMIWSVLKSCHERGWIYKGADSMPWCPRCSTGISQHEIVTEGYRELTHPSDYLRFPLKGREGSLLIWTTTPWTLTSNVAVAVHPDLDYMKVRYDGEVLYLSKGTLVSVFPEGGYEVIGELQGVEMDGWGYDGPYDELELPRRLGAPEAHRVIFWEEVGEAEGTGLVHIAPGAGKEDFELGLEYDLPIVAPLDEFGVFIDGLGWLSGTHVYDSAEPIFQDLRRKGLILRTEDYTHRYPVCWRCDSELVFRHVEEWFIDMGEKLDKLLEEVTEEEKEQNLRYQIMDSACETHWIPEFGLKRELDWLRNMDDWMISKKRYWGLALPIWECECGWFDVIGSREELKDRAVEGWEEFEGHSPHKPYIDAVKIRCERCGKIVSRIADVGNPWLDAGIVAYSTLDYRTDREYWEKWFPAHFITEEYIGQFRNWFYSMLAMSTILERTTPFKVCLGHGTVKAEDGREMHKSWGNAIEFNDAAETMGADIVRWMFCSTKPENDILFGYTGAGEVKRLFFMPLLNVYNFFAIYADLDMWAPGQQPKSISELDRWILSRLNSLVAKVTEELDGFDIYNPTREIERFVDDLSKWYVRRSRRRFWKSETDEDKRAAYSTLYKCLKKLTLLMAPITPFITEAIYQRLVRSVEPYAPESVHLNRWPEVEISLLDEDLMEKMDLAIKVSSLGRAARSMSGIKLRQPLMEAVVVGEEAILKRLEGLKGLIGEELNVKKVRLSPRKNELQRYVVNPVHDLLGKKYVRNLPRVAETIKNLDQDQAASLLAGEPVEVYVDGAPVMLLSDEVDVLSEPVTGYSVMEEPGLMVGVNTKITKKLGLEGLARDVVRRIQALRKEADFEIDDLIETYYSGDPEIEEVFVVEGDYIAVETLSKVLRKGGPPNGAFMGEFDIDGLKLKLGLVRR
ncbi:MAG: class I tRNA ligase family protein, partial [Candidatus Bathyarchaeia archaeon]